jgi:Domain of Unknown Function (DUF928)
MKPAPRQRPISPSLSGLLALAMVTLLAPAAQAQFTSPPDQGTPRGTAGGGSRPIGVACLAQPQSQEPLLALAPTQSVGLTTQATPSFWVYVPKTTAKTLEFTLSSRNPEVGYQVNLPVQTAGLLKITLPLGTTLTTGRLYTWKVALVCDPEDRTKDWVVDSVIRQQPLAANLQRQLAAVTPEQQVSLYTQSGFWYDGLNAYLTLRQFQPNDPNLPTIWANLVKSAGLSALPQPLHPTSPVSPIQSPR